MSNARRFFFYLSLLPAFVACADRGLGAGGKTCTQGGKTYHPGDSWKVDCNTCSCTAAGEVSCTLMGCLGTGGMVSSGGVVGTGGSAGGVTGGSGGALGTGGLAAGGAIGTGGATALPDAASPLTCTVNGNTYQLGQSWQLDCNTCTCTASGASCTKMACRADGGGDARSVDARPTDSTVVCLYNGTTLLPGQSVSNGCDICSCSNTGTLMCTGACPPDASPAVDTAAPVCTLSSNLTFGHDGGMVIYQDTNRLTSTTFTITRSYMRGTVPDGAIASCSPKLPACGASGVVTVATINADLADAEVQAAWKTAQASGTLYGTDQRPVDGTVYAIALDDGRKLLVGGQCASPAMSSCRTIPAGLVRLRSDLDSLATAMAADPVCKGL
jgi:hypothetical protein